METFALISHVTLFVTDTSHQKLKPLDIADDRLQATMYDAQHQVYICLPCLIYNFENHKPSQDSGFSFWNNLGKDKKATIITYTPTGH